MKTNMNINSNRCSFVSPNIVNAEFSVSDENKIKLKTSLWRDETNSGTDRFKIGTLEML